MPIKIIPSAPEKIFMLLCFLARTALPRIFVARTSALRFAQQLLLSIATTTALVPHVYSDSYTVPWESEFNLPAQTPSGFSIVKPSPASRLIYVSSSDGNDSNARFYTIENPTVGESFRQPVGAVRAYASIAAARAQMREGHPDYILFKRGDTFDGSLKGNRGKSAAARSVATWYGDKPQRPYFRTGTDSGIKAANASYFAVIGLRFHAHKRDPNDPAFVGRENAGKAAGIDATSFSGLTGLLIEDCWLSWYDENTIQAPNYHGAERLTDIIVRRNLIEMNYSDGSSYSQGLFSYRSSVLLEENTFYHNGWYCQAESPGCTTGQATMFGHNTYFSEARNTIFRRNIFISPSSINMKFTSNATSEKNTIKAWNILIENNLLIDGEVGISIGGNKDYDNGPRWRDIRIVNNVIMHNGESRQTNRTLGWGILIDDWQTGVIRGNILSQWGSPTVQNTYGIAISGHNENLDVVDNMFFDIAGKADRSLLSIHNLVDAKNIKVANNHWAGPSISRPLIAAPVDAQIQFSNNRLHSDGALSAGQKRSRNPAAESSIQTTGSLRTESGRNLASYLQSHLDAPPTIPFLLVKLREQSEKNWHHQFSAAEINNYIRQGFCLNGIFCG